MTIKLKHFVRLIVDRELSQDELEGFFYIVNDHSDVKSFTSYDIDDEEFVDTEISYVEKDEFHMYEILLIDNISEADGEQISWALSELLNIDFEFEASTDF